MKKIIFSSVLFCTLTLSIGVVGLNLVTLALVNVDPRYVVYDKTPHLFEKKRDDWEGQNWWKIGGNWVVEEQQAARQLGLNENYYVYEVKSWENGDTGFCDYSVQFEVSKTRTQVTMTDLEIRPAKFPYIFNRVNYRDLWRLESPVVIQVDHDSDGMNQQDGICINPKVVAKFVK